jgi:hypothetical protein
MIPRSLRLVQPRIEQDVLIVRTAQEARARAESLSGHPMQPSREESAALDRIAYWERYLIRWRVDHDEPKPRSER